MNHLFQRGAAAPSGTLSAALMDPSFSQVVPLRGHAPVQRPGAGSEPARPAALALLWRRWRRGGASAPPTGWELLLERVHCTFK